MHGKQLRASLGSGILLLVASTLVLAACNSGSGTSQKSSGGGNRVTGAESPAPAKILGKGTIAEALSEKVTGTR